MQIPLATSAPELSQSPFNTMGSVLESTDAKNKLEDLSGVVIGPGENPYDALITACSNDPVSSGLDG